MSPPRTILAFSLVETVIALGIMAFALVAIVGLLPVALTSSRESDLATRESLVVADAFQRTVTDLRQLPHNQWPPEMANTLYYSQEGVPMADTVNEGHESVFFEIATSVSPLVPVVLANLHLSSDSAVVVSISVNRKGQNAGTRSSFVVRRE
jgi:uncharacterized protein (TIGR02598 family)